MRAVSYGFCLFLAVTLAGCGGDNLQFDFPEPTPAPDPGPPPPSPQDRLSSSPPQGMTGRILYMGQVNNTFASVHLFLTTPDGSSPPTSLFQLSDPFSYTGPSWGPTGDRVAIASNQLGNAEWDIYTVNLDGSGILPAVAGPSSGDFAPAWSPDGARIVFQSTTDAVNGFDIYHYDISTNTMTNLTNSPGDDELPTWSPDGQRVLFQTTSSGGTNLFTVMPDGSDLTPLTTDTGVQNSAGQYSPDGSTIVFESTRHQPASAVATLGDFEIYAMNADGTNVRRLTTGVGEADAVRFPTWSPDGRHIACEFHDFTISQLFSVTFIAVMNADGSNIYLLKDQPVQGLFPRWGP